MRVADIRMITGSSQRSNPVVPIHRLKITAAVRSSFISYNSKYDRMFAGARQICSQDHIHARLLTNFSPVNQSLDSSEFSIA